MRVELDQAPAYLLSQTRIPPSPDLGPDRVGRFRWLSTDSEANYRKRPHPTIGPEDVEYRINAHGYRCPDLDGVRFHADESVRIVGVGSSGLFGAALPEPDTFLAVLARSLEGHLGRPVSHWNLGVGGSSADFVSRLLFSVLPVMRPHILILTAFPINRRELLGESGRAFLVDARPHWQHRLLDPERSAMHRACRTFCNPYNNLMNTLVNFKTWECLCDDAGVPWLFMTESYTEHLSPIRSHLREPCRIVGPGIHALIDRHKGDPATGLARDHAHAGRLPNRLMADELMERLLELYPEQLEALARRRRAEAETAAET